MRSAVRGAVCGAEWGDKREHNKAENVNNVRCALLELIGLKGVYT